MKSLFFLLLLTVLLPLSSTRIFARDESQAALAQAKLYVAAVENHDYEKAVDFMPEDTVAKDGGRAKEIETMKDDPFASVFKFLDVKFPHDPILIPSDDAVIYRVDTDMIVLLDKTKIRDRSFLLFYHLNKDSHWHALDGSKVKVDDVKQRFHGIPNDLSFPADIQEEIKDAPDAAAAAPAAADH